MKKQTCIEKILHARSIAVIGASNEAGSVGNEVILRLKATFTGRVYPVNLHEKTIEGLKCFKNVREVGKPIDVAIIAVPNTAVLGVIEDCHQALIAALDKPERRLVLQIIDAKDQIAEDRSIDSFIAGFRLAWRLSNELNMYEKTRPMLTPREMVAGMDAFIHDEN